MPRSIPLQITQVAADRKLDLDQLEPRSSGDELSLVDLFTEYLATTGTTGAAATQVRANLAEFLAAADEEREPAFPEVALLTEHACSATDDQAQAAPA